MEGETVRSGLCATGVGVVGRENVATGLVGAVHLN